MTMPNIVGKTIERYPKLPALLANVAVGKVIQLIKDKAIDPALDHEQMVQKIQSWPKPVKKAAEWILYTLSGAVRTMPEQQHPIAIVLQEALAEALTQTGIKVDEISIADRKEIINATIPIVRSEVIGAVKKDHQFRERLDAILGTAHDWDKIFQEADDFISHVSEKTQAHRAARKARGWRRFLWR